MKPETREQLEHIRQRLEADRSRRAEYTPKEFERDIVALLDSEYSFCVMPSVRLFGTRERDASDYGNEIDAILHVKKDALDLLLLIEVKKQSLKLVGDEWVATYDDGPKPVRAQINKHAKIVREYLRPLSRHTELKLVSLVASSDPTTGHIRKEGDLGTPQHLSSYIQLVAIIDGLIKESGIDQGPPGRVLRVEQSLFLNTLRLGLPEPHLGHPELANAVRYVERCRRALDEALFQQFNPSPERWLIIGTAGMGKSVLLAYAAAVLTSEHRLEVFKGETYTRKDSELFAKIGYNADPKQGSVALMAMSDKQLQSLKAWYVFFQERLREGDHAGRVTFRPPVFVLCRDKESFKSSSQWSAVLIDEAHDLPVWAPSMVAELEDTYVVAAFDPHQRIRQNELSTRYIPGLNFSLKSLRLRQVYRNPAPIYIAALALMFRWFSKQGPKIVPTVLELREMFGLRANLVPGGQGLKVSMTSDAHPANSWCHTVGQLPDAATAYAILTNERMGRREVLWVRFSEEDPDFDYEALARNFTYHNCRIPNADELSNKYIKGQDYPIVVIEGFPGFMDGYATSEGQNAEEAERRMWQFRRELYLCASRATCFLYFICKVPESAPITRIRGELDALIAATSIPEDRHTGGTRTWSFHIPNSNMARTLAALEQLEASTATDVAEPEITTSKLSAPSSVTAPRAAPVPPSPVPPARPAPPIPPKPATAISPSPTPLGAPMPPPKPAAPLIPATTNRPIPSPPVPSMPKAATPPVPQQSGAAPKVTAPAAFPSISLRGEITPRNLATALGKRSALEIIRALQLHGESAKHDTVISREVATVICKQEGYTLSQ